MGCCTQKTCLITQSVIGVIIALLSVILIAVWPDLYKNIFDNSVILTKNSFSYGMWKETPIPMYLELYLFNFTNSAEVIKDSENVKPHFEECGPYVFKEHHIKTNITWHENGTVTFLQRRIWHFDQNLSNGSLSDNITNINIVAASAAYFVRHSSNIVQVAVNTALKMFGEHPVITRTAGELLFEGYSDKLLQFVKKLDLPGFQLNMDKFGWFYDRNMSDIYDGWWTIHTGQKDITKVGDMNLWNFRNVTDFYDDECAVVKGTTGELFPPRTDPQQVTVFASDICSYMSLKRVGEIEVEGIKGLSFKGDSLQFDNGANYPSTRCFCRRGDDCPPAGARNVSLCKFGAPAFVSYPHFYLADPIYTQQISGVTPNEKEDSFEMALEPVTGIPLLVNAQLQINILIQRIRHISFFDELPHMVYLPVLRFKQEVKITKELAAQARIALQIENIVSIALYCLIALGVVLLLLAIFIARKSSLRRTESTDLLTDE